MPLATIFDIAGTGMTAQATRLNVIASNLSNQDSIASSAGETYRARMPVFAATLKDAIDEYDYDAGVAGVRIAGIVEDQSELRKELQPGHPLADENGYITLPNVNAVKEMADMMSASRSYQDNVKMMDTAKNLILRTLSSMQDRV